MERGTTVLLSDAEGSAGVAALLAPSSEAAVPWYGSVEELVDHEALGRIGVLVVHCPPMPKGTLLATLGRLSLEFPRMQKVAVLEGPLSLPVAEYLTMCGVEVVWTDTREEAMGRLSAVMDHIHERTGWIAG